MALSKTQPTNPVLLEFSKHDFVGLGTELIRPLRKPLEHTKQIHRFWNDEYVKKNIPKPTLYDHILEGLVFAKKNLFNNLEGVSKLAKDFNRAYMVHDFGEMITEFSTFYGRYKQRNEAQEQQRSKVERNVAELVFKSVKVFGGKFFSIIFTEASKQLDKAKTVPDKLKEASEHIKTGNQISDLLRERYDQALGKIHNFAEKWMRYFDLSQDPKNEDSSFVANLVKFVDKMSDQEKAQEVHRKNIPKAFKRALILRYMRAYRKLKECSEALAANAGTAADKVLNNVTNFVERQFKKDNSELGAKTKFDNFDQAYEESLAMLA